MYITIPNLPGSSLCPETALGKMLAVVPGSENDSLFCIFRQGCWVSLTDGIANKYMKELSIFWWPIEAIKSQGT